MKLPFIKFAVPIIIILILIIVFVSASSRGKIEQPIQYNHKVHIEEAGLECTDCHQYVENYARATIPNIKVCVDCHSDEPLTNSIEEKKLLNYISSNKRIPWVQIYYVPNHVYFSHRRHVKIGEIKCIECHGDVANLTEPAPFQLVKISMNNCIECHDKHDVINDCIGCHY